LGTITYHYHFFDSAGLCLQLQCDIAGILAYFYGCGLITHHREFQYVTGIHTDGEDTTAVGGSSFGGAFYHDRDAGQGVAILIGDLPCYNLFERGDVHRVPVGFGVEVVLCVVIVAFLHQHDLEAGYMVKDVQRRQQTVQHIRQTLVVG